MTKKIHSFHYLIDQQISQEMLIELMNVEKTGRPIVISTRTRMFSDNKKEVLRLTREQCVELVFGLQKALKLTPELSKLIDISNSDYEGKII